MNKSVQVWIGLAHVKPKSNKVSLLDGAIGAFFSGLVLARDKKDYITKLTKFIEGEGFDIIEVEDVEPFKEYEKKYNPKKEIYKLVETLNGETSIAVSTFDTYEHE